MRFVICIQHTQSVHHTNGMVGSWTDWDITNIGIQQANRIGENLKKKFLQTSFVMYSSDLLRAKHTAEIVGSYLGLSPMLAAELRERRLGKRTLCTSTHKERYEQKSIMYSTSLKSSETEQIALFHCA